MNRSLRHVGIVVAACLCLATLGAAPAAAETPSAPTIQHCWVNGISTWRPEHLAFTSMCYYHEQDALPEGYAAEVLLTNKGTGQVIRVPLGTSIRHYNEEVVVPPGAWFGALSLRTPEGSFVQGVDSEARPLGPVLVKRLDLSVRPRVHHIGWRGLDYDTIPGGGKRFFVRFSEPVRGVSGSTVRVFDPSGKALAIVVTYDPKTWNATVHRKDWSSFETGSQYRVVVSGAITNPRSLRIVASSELKTAA